VGRPENGLLVKPLGHDLPAGGQTAVAESAGTEMAGTPAKSGGGVGWAGVSPPEQTQ